MYTVYKKCVYCPAYRQEHITSRSTFLFWVLVAGTLFMGFLPNTVTAATYYVDNTNGNDSNPGTSVLPWKSWSKVQSTIVSGDTVCMTGDFGSIAFTSTSPFGTSENWITYSNWPGKPAPTFNYVDFTGIAGFYDDPKDVYIKFIGIHIDPGYVATPSSPGYVVNMHNSKHVIFDGCHFEGEKIAGVEINQGDFAPYFFNAGAIISAGNSPAISSFITIQNSVIKNGFYGLRLVQHPSFPDRKVENWTVINNDFSNTAEDCIVTSYSGYHSIVDNLFYDTCQHKGIISWPGSGTGDWSNKKFESVTQDVSGGTGLFFVISDGRFWIYPNDADHLPPRNSTNVWRLDSNPDNTYFTPSGSGDNPHTDMIAVQASSHDIEIKRNKFHSYDTFGAQTIKIEPPASNISFINNEVRQDFYVGVSCMLIAGTNTQIYNNTIVTVSNSFRLITDGSGSDVHLYNNIISSAIYTSGTIHSNYNIWSNTPPSEFNEGPNSVIVSNFNGVFAEQGNFDFNLAPGSVAIDFGNSDYAPVTDILGVSRIFPPDAGCYEYISSDPNNLAPTADAGTDQTVTDSDGNGSESINLNGSNSVDSDGTIVSYVWREGAVQIGTGQQPTVTLNVGTHIITLTVTDGDGATDTDTITVTVNAGNQAPTADAGTDQTVTDTDGNGSESVTLDASNSDDSDGTVTSYVWSEGATQIATGQQPTIALNVNTHIITLTVTDDDGATDTDTVTVTINPGNQAPTADAGTDQTLTDDDGNGSEPVTFDASGSGDWDGTITSYVWSEGATQIATGQQPTVTLNVGTHVITLTVTDDDGATDTDTVTITVNVVDTTAPTVTNLSPQADTIQTPLNTLVTLNITDSGDGVDADSVTIEVNGNVVYTGNTTKYSSASGECYRVGTAADYEFIYQSNEIFNFDQFINVTANASDLAGNVMDEYSYSFQTEMRSFGKNILVDSDDLPKGGPVTVRDSGGNIWVVWHAGTTSNKDIYINKLTAGSDAFGNSIKLTDSIADQRNPAIALGSDDKIYVAWQDSRGGNWDIYVSTSTDGVNFSAGTRVTDSNDNEINPAIIVDSSLPNKAYIAWEDSRNGNQDIYIGISSNGFVSTTTSQITSDLAYQGEPAIAVDSDNTVYVVWTDRRITGTNNIYGAASNSGPWTNIPIVTEDQSQSSPVIATEAARAVLHLVWVDDRDGENDIYYAQTSNGLPASPLSGSNIIDDTTNADQKQPVIAVAGSIGSNLQVFACWYDERNEDDDLYLAEISSGSGTNVFVGDDGTSSNQSEPAIGIDGNGQPYLVWTNDNLDIYYAGSTTTESGILASGNISTSTKVTLGVPLNDIDSIDDISIEVPSGAYVCEIEITISKVKNPPYTSKEYLSLPYEFGPSGIEFAQPVTITIPYEIPVSDYSVSAYWNNPLTGIPSQEGITDVETIVISSTLYALRFKTTHFTQFFVGGSSSSSSISSISGGGGGGGGCSMSPDSHASAVELMLPYIGLTVAMVILKLRDRRKRKTCNIT